MQYIEIYYGELEKQVTLLSEPEIHGNNINYAFYGSNSNSISTLASILKLVFNDY